MHVLRGALLLFAYSCCAAEFPPPPGCACNRTHPYCDTDDGYCYASDISNVRSSTVCPGSCTASYSPPKKCTCSTDHPYCWTSDYYCYTGPQGCAKDWSVCPEGCTDSNAASPGPSPWAPTPTKKTLKMPNGNLRTYLLRLPKGYNGTGAPAVFDFHGANEDPQTQWPYSNYMNLADRDSVILVYPESKNAEWHCDLRMPDNRVDYEFVLALVKELRKEHSATSFFASGLSSGGDISSCLACEVDNPFEGFGVVAYAYYWGTDPKTGKQYNGNKMSTAPNSLVTGKTQTQDCSKSKPKPFMYFHGTDDNVCLYNGTTDKWHDPPREEVAQRWATHNGCTGSPTKTKIGSDVVHFTWGGCAAPTHFYKIVGGGHTWPGNPCDDISDTIDASELLWKFWKLSK